MPNKNATKYVEKMTGGELSSLSQTDPEFYELFCNFAFDEVINEHPLPDRTCHLAILATLLGCGGTDAFSGEVAAALHFGVTAAEIKEVIYQAVAYLGIGRVLPFFNIANSRLVREGAELPTEPRATVTADSRISDGENKQVEIFGEGMRGFSRRGGETEHINRWLSGNCFGDYYTRKGLSDSDREMITFCYLAAQGGCEPQLTSHAAANMRIGNDKQFLICVVSQCLPYIGYPRSLNALTCISKASEMK